MVVELKSLPQMQLDHHLFEVEFCLQQIEHYLGIALDEPIVHS